MTDPYYEDDLVTLYHGDCREVTAWLEADVLVMDPPYGIDYRSNRTKSEVVARSIANDKDTKVRDWVMTLWGHGRRSMVFASPALPALPYDARLVWHKPGSGMGDLAMPWKPDYEWVFVRGRDYIGQRDTSVLTFPLRVFRGDIEHPHQKPVDLMERLLMKCRPEWVVADPFSGSGSTLVACKNLGRKAIGVELEERYCEIAAKRLSQDTLFGGVA